MHGDIRDHPLYVPCLSRRVQSCTRTSFGRRVWFFESLIVLVIFFLLISSFILDIKGVLSSSYITKSFSSKIPQSLYLHILTDTLLLLHCSPTGLFLSIIYCWLFPCLNLSLYTTPPTYHQRFLDIRWQIKLLTYGYELSVTDESEPNKQIHQKYSATIHTYMPYWLLSLSRWTSSF